VNRSEAGRSATEARSLAGRRSLTVLCLLGLVLGAVLGTVMQQLDSGIGAGGISIADALIRAWTNAFRLVVPFLVVSQLYIALAARAPTAAGAARLGLVVASVFATLWVLLALASTAASVAVLALPVLRGDSLGPSAVGGALQQAGGAVASAAQGPWVDELIPPNLFASASTDNLLPLMLFTLVVAGAARRLGPELRGLLERGFTAVRDVMFVLVDWLIRPAPVMLFAFGFRFGAGAGLAVGGILLKFAAIEVVLLLLGTAALYLVACIAGGFSLGRFARAMSPAQLTAITTRSSLATLPALLKAADQDLRISPMISSLVLPLAGATFKLSRAVGYPLTLLFLARLLGVQLGFQPVAVFLLTVAVLTPTTPGVPRMLANARTVPAFVRAGIPAEYVFLFGTVSAITDVFLTLINSTGYMAANVLVARFGPRAQVAETSHSGGRDHAAVALTPQANRPAP